MHRVAFTLSLLLSASVAAVASAGPTAAELDAARVEFSHGLGAEDAGRFQEAIGHYQTVMKTKATAQVRLHIAYCLRKIGHLVEAAAELERAQTDGVALGAQGEELAQRAARERDMLYAATPRLSVKLVSGGRPHTVSLDGETTPLGEEAITVDPGSHHLVVDTPNGPFARDFVVREQRPAMVVEVLVQDGKTFRVAPATIIGAGLTVATFGAMIVTGVMQTSVASTLDPECGTTGKSCPASAQPDIDRVHTLTTATNVLLTVGLALAVGTGILFFTTSFHGARRQPTAFITPFGVSAHF